MSERKEKVAQRIKEEIGEILHSQIKDPRIGFVTITKVEVTSDLRSARVFYSVLGGEEEKKSAKEGLESALKYIRGLIGERLKIRYTPDICFKIDNSSEYSIRIGKIFQVIEDEREKKERETDA
ncbi:MAG: 30S ribosome-binding factor RbfA [Candidatus Omnitrophica bacterium]|nr:30S ribosome-binding factor RbfA [Candidatus Omnitrophota bacterium]